MALMDNVITMLNATTAKRKDVRRERLANMAATLQARTPITTNVGSIPLTNISAPKGGGGNVDKWINQAMDVLGVRLDPQRLNALKTIIQKESGGNPRAINNWDSNAKRGTPSQGLMQTIPGTFKSYKLPGYDNILDPVSNIIAGYRYANKRYGDILNVPGVKAMRKGGAYRGY